MPIPFPGMDPYLEHPDIWPGVHLLLIAALSDVLTPQLRPKYAVSVEVRMYETVGENSLLVGIPDVAVKKVAQVRQSDPVATLAQKATPITVNLPIPMMVRQGYLEIKEVATQAVITAIEILSPTNKRPGRGRQAYETKRSRVFASATHWVEIDLLRTGEPMPILGSNLASDYRILVSRADQRPQADWYGFDVGDSIPNFVLPLQPGDAEPVIDLTSLLQQIYDRGGYDLKLDYRQAPIPPFDAPTSDWVEAQLKAHALR
jgi:Protein of unknown function (DUF4058)